MMRKEEGVVLRCSRSGETSKLATFLGRESGKVKLLGKGALTSRSTLGAALQSGNVIEAVYYYKEGRSLFFIKEAHTLIGPAPLGISLGEAAASLALFELADAVCFWQSPEPRAVDLLVECRGLDGVGDPLMRFLGAQVKLLDILGALPDFGTCAMCGRRLESGHFDPGEARSACRAHSRASPHRVPLDGPLLALLNALVAMPLAEACRRPAAGRDTRKRLGKILHWTYTFHIQGYRLPEALKLIPKV